MKTFYITSKGDRSTGVPSGYAEVTVNGLPDGDSTLLETQFKEQLAEVFEGLWDQKVTVQVKAEANREPNSDYDFDDWRPSPIIKGKT